MGVNSLWDILGPTARPVRLEALSRKKLAVDASIWIYQFLKAVRDSQGDAMQLSHIVGFFRRICKLLYFGILPVFVFDGGAPVLKRETISKRRERREGNRESVQETAHRLLAILVQRQKKDDAIKQSPKKRFVARDEYHLPHIKRIRVGADDERLMPEDEFDQFALESFDIVDGININNVDPKSEEFAELPMPTQYMILSHLRLKSRLRMGFSKEQLENIFPDSMDFSKFQIQQVQKRNYYTQKLMNISGMGEEGNATRRIAGDKDRQYALVRTNDGWSLSLADEQSDPLSTVDAKPALEDLTEEPNQFNKPEVIESDSDFEDVPLQGPEESEETEFNKAVIESIYELYSDRDKDLKQAIEDSKRDLFQMQEKELAMENGETFDFGESLLFAPGEPAQPVEPAESIQPLDTVESVSIEEPLESLTREPQSVAETPQAEPIEPEEPIEPKQPKDSVPEGVDIVELLDEDPEDNEKEAKKDAKKDAPREMPQWFGGDVDRQVHFVETNDEPQTIDDDEAAGLIPWYEAKELIDRRDEEPPKETHPESNRIPSYRQKLADETEKQKSSEKETPKKAEPILDYVFIDDEEKIAEKQLQSEQLDHENLKRQIHSSQEIPMNFTNTSISEAQLLQERYHKQKRDAEEVTQTMINDVQELLRRFGIPFITAPMEAEAQCAELLKLGLVDGIVTDDSDCFLFGGDRVYKNMFNQKKYVECYINDDLSNKLGLNQHRLIELGLLLGSDYTEGIKGIGPVLAMEILAEFGSLEKFKQWFDDAVLDRVEATTTVKKTLITRVASSKLFLPPLFPDKIVFEAYVHPEVDSSTEPIKWGVPDLDSIRSFLMYNVGWSQSRVDEVMVPLIRDMNRKLREGSQSTIGEFFTSSHLQSSKEIKLGKRLKAATSKLNKRQGQSSEKEGASNTRQGTE